VHGSHVRAERVGRDWVGLSSTWSTSKRRGAHIGSMAKACPLDDTPLGGHSVTSGTCTATTRAPSVSGVTGWVLASRRASRSAGARTGSICAGVALRRVRTVRRTRGPWRPLEPRHVPDAHAGRGREEHGVYGYRPRP